MFKFNLLETFNYTEAAGSSSTSSKKSSVEQKVIFTASLIKKIVVALIVGFIITMTYVLWQYFSTDEAVSTTVVGKQPETPTPLTATATA